MPRKPSKLKEKKEGKPGGLKVKMPVDIPWCNRSNDIEVLSFDPGQVNCGQVYLKRTKKGGFIHFPKVYNFQRKLDSNDLSGIIKNINILFGKNKGIKYALQACEETKGEYPHIKIETQEGFPKGNYSLAKAMARMSNIAGAIFMYFIDRGFKNVHFIPKQTKWRPKFLDVQRGSNPKVANRRVVKYLLKNLKDKSFAKWKKKHPTTQQHVIDCIAQGVLDFIH